MPKVIVTANEDFFDGANQIQRTKGSEFVLKGDYAKSLGNAVKIGDTVNKEAKAPKKKAAKEKKTNVRPTAKKDYTNAGIEKVKK